MQSVQVYSISGLNSKGDGLTGGVGNLISLKAFLMGTDVYSLGRATRLMSPLATGHLFTHNSANFTVFVCGVLGKVFICPKINEAPS